jgi:UDP-N-acetylmuramate dehydrogenase
LFCEVHTVGQLLAAVEAARSQGIEFTIVGGGSNLLVSDAGIRGLVIKNSSRGSVILSSRAPEPLFFSIPASWKLGEFSGEEGWLLVAGGEPIARLARRLARAGIEGLQWAAGLPGSVASAVVNNAGAFGSDMAGSMGRAAIVDSSGRYLAEPEDLSMVYRSSRLKGKRDAVVASVELRLRKGDRTGLARFLTEADTFRRTCQPKEPSCGSVFKNPQEAPAGYLIERAGLKGVKIGGAHVSMVHANFIVNAGGATARDVLQLIDLCRRRVMEAFGVELELEIELVGDW